MVVALLEDLLDDEKSKMAYPYIYGRKVFFGRELKLFSNVSIKEMPGALVFICLNLLGHILSL